MVKIPTYNSRLTPQPTFTKPVAPKGIAENIKSVAEYANAIADERAEVKAYEKGFKQQKEVLSQIDPKCLPSGFQQCCLGSYAGVIQCFYE